MEFVKFDVIFFAPDLGRENGNPSQVGKLIVQPHVVKTGLESDADDELDGFERPTDFGQDGFEIGGKG